MAKTKVKFVIDNRYDDGEPDDVIAVMVNDVHPNGEMTCYQHIGQHGLCSHDWLTLETRLATPEEYAPLLKELTDIGYTIKDANVEFWKKYKINV